MKFEKGYDTDVNERGTRLSAGQRQLIAFARTLLADPRILILDEATASIDTQTERLVQQGIRKLLKDRTSFVIAHRLSTIRNADRIMVVEDGGIVETGTHEELIRLRGQYYNLYASQFRFLRDEEAG
jgi:ATP-binding cassette subfamily B protein